MTPERAQRRLEQLLRLYPRAFRVRFADGMRFAFDEELRQCRTPAQVRALVRRSTWHMLAGALDAYRVANHPRKRPMPSHITTDLRQACRTLLATPLVTAVAVLSLALGIGSNTALFSIVDSLLLKTLPVEAPEQLVLLSRGSVTNPIWESLRSRETDIADGMFAWSSTQLNLAAQGEAEFVSGLRASGRMFEVLGVSTILGRPLTVDDDVRAGSGPDGPVAVLGYDFWQRRFGGSPDAIGQSLYLNNVPYTIVGVAPASFFGPEVGERFDVAVPLGAISLEPGSATILDARSAWWLEIMARLRPSQTVEDATAALNGLRPIIREETMPLNWIAESRAQYLTDDFAFVPAATGTSSLRQRYTSPLTALMVIVGLVLLIACGNIANLLLARATARRQEFSLRLALGASRLRLARQLFTESLLLAGAGAVLGLVFARLTAPLLIGQLASAGSRVSLSVTTDWRMVGFAFAVALVTALIFGVAPALNATRVAPNEALKSAGRTVAGDGYFSLRHALVVAQIAMSLVLVVGVLLFTQTFARLATLDVGFDADPLLVVTATASDQVAPDSRLALFERLRDSAAAVPGVAAASVSVLTPVSGSSWNTEIEIPGRTIPDGPESLPMVNYVQPGWFETYGTAIVEGRGLVDTDRSGAPMVVVVNQAFAHRFFQEDSAVGQTIVETPMRDGDKPKVYQVVGVARDAVYRRLKEPVPPTMYLPLAQFGESLVRSASITVRSQAGPPEALTRTLVDAFTRVDPSLSLTFRPLADQVEASLVQERLVAMVSAFFGGLALLLAALGLYGVTAYAVNRRRREIGVRLALGANPTGIVGLILKRVTVTVGLGLAGGAMLSFWASAFVGTLLYGVTARDPMVFVAAATILTAVSLAAGWLPAKRAARVDPARVLRDA